MRTRLVGQPEALEHDDVGAVVDGELDVGQHVALVALADEERTALAGRLGREAPAVDQPDAERDRIDAEARPRQVEERQRRQHLHLDARRRRAGARRCARRRPASPGTAYSTSPCSAAAATSASTMAAYTSSNESARLVEVVERRRVGARADAAGCRLRAEVAVRDRVDPRERAGGEQVRARRPEPDDGDPGRLTGSGADEGSAAPTAPSGA